MPQGADLLPGDLRHPADVAAALKDCPLVFHLAGNANGTISVEDPRRDFEANVLGTFHLLEAARKGDVDRFVYVSSASVYGIPRSFPMDEEHPRRPFVPYGVSKLAAESYCRTFWSTYGLPTVIARPFCVYGPDEDPGRGLVEVSRYLRWHLNGLAIQVVGDPDRKTRDFVHVDDVVQALLLLANRGSRGEAYNVGSGTETSLRQLAEMVSQVTDREAELSEIRDVTEDTYRLVADISKLVELGYAPEVSLEDGISRLAGVLGEHPPPPEGATIFHEGQEAEK